MRLPYRESSAFCKSGSRSSTLPFFYSDSGSQYSSSCGFHFRYDAMSSKELAESLTIWNQTS